MEVDQERRVDVSVREEQLEEEREVRIRADRAEREGREGTDGVPAGPMMSTRMRSIRSSYVRTRIVSVRSITRNVCQQLDKDTCTPLVTSDSPGSELANTLNSFCIRVEKAAFCLPTGVL